MSKKFTKTVEELEKIFAADKLYNDNDFTRQIIEKLLCDYENNERKLFYQYSHQYSLALLVAGRSSIINSLGNVPIVFADDSTNALSLVAERIRMEHAVLSGTAVNRDDVAHFFDSNNLPAPLALFPHRPDTTERVLSVVNNDNQGWSTNVDLLEVMSLVTELRGFGVLTKSEAKSTGRKNKLTLEECRLFYVECIEKHRKYHEIAATHKWLLSSFKDDPNPSTAKSRVIKAVERYRNYLATIGPNQS